MLQYQSRCCVSEEVYRGRDLWKVFSIIGVEGQAAAEPPAVDWGSTGALGKEQGRRASAGGEQVKALEREKSFCLISRRLFLFT